MCIDNYQQFLEQIIKAIMECGINVSNLEMDHIGYQASSNEDYDDLIPQFGEIGEMVSETVVGRRRVGIFKLIPQLKFKGYIISAIELIAPKDGQVCPSALEHVEFVINEEIGTFMQKYPAVNWDASAINQKDFPMIKLRLTEHAQVKFHKTNVLEIVEKRGLSK